MISTLDFESIHQEPKDDNEWNLRSDEYNLDNITIDREYIGLWPAILKVMKGEW